MHVERHVDAAHLQSPGLPDEDEGLNPGNLRPYSRSLRSWACLRFAKLYVSDLDAIQLRAELKSPPIPKSIHCPRTVRQSADLDPVRLVQHSCPPVIRNPCIEPPIWRRPVSWMPCILVRGDPTGQPSPRMEPGRLEDPGSKSS
jgi:hypothetical protein